MASFSKLKLSGSTDGKNIKITTTATPGDLIHTAHATDLDEVWLWITNTSTSSVKVTVEWGEHTAPDGNIEMTIAAEDGPKLIIPGWVLTNSMDVNVFAGAANVIVVNGFVNRITA